ncbi:hypothetical protein [uncultured Roseobacter sp.]|uniref:hypothetical protein n=1 Tax=uncultured Roseobacter sp. TaxID=114847 RepID=UPI0026230F6F|nr:hypothetical protein [uncultured Roseobacter sp.]
MFVSAFLSVIGLGFLVWVLFTLAIYALPAFVGITVGMYVYGTEAGVSAALVAGMFAAVFTLLIGQIVFAKVQSVPVRLVIATIFAAPAGVAGFSAIKGLSQIGGASESWTLAFAIVGGIVVAGTAWVRIASLAGPPDEDDDRHKQLKQAQPFSNDR